VQVCRKYVAFFSYVVFWFCSCGGQTHEAQGIKFHMASKVEKIVPQEGNPALAGGVVVNGTTIPADFVIKGVGVAPATAFLKGSGIKLESDGGVKVDQYLRVQSGPDMNDVYAIGIFSYFSLSASRN
jgi:NADPH-dependent 2,4-dienoyl-CoA reductase/sulfur reductase-like enzyme